MFRDEPIVHVMTREVHTVELGTPLSTLRRLLAHHPFDHVPVVEGGRLVGMVSARDLLPICLHHFVRDEATADAHLDASFHLGDVMTADVETVGVTDTVGRAAELLAQGRFHAVPVVENSGALVGIVTSTDLVRAFIQG